MTSLVLTVTETLRYRGKLGQWAWALHRISGMGTLLFVILHVIDTSWATFYPDLYAKAIAAYKTPLFTVGEFILVACVVYHALNGFRIALFDYRPQWWRRQADAAKLVLIGTGILLVPVFLLMFGHVVNYYNERVFGQGKSFDLGLELVIESQLPFVAGIVVVLAASLVASIGVGVVLPGVDGPKVDKKTGKRVYGRSRFDSIMWSFMRLSGVLIIPLVFGHLAMLHVIQGVFDITKVGHIPVGTNLGPNVADEAMAAANFVALRWNTMIAGVAIWRVYDMLLLVLIIIHGFNGARYVVNDYIHNRVVNRALRIALIGATVGYIIVGGLAIINTIPATTEKLLSQTETSQVEQGK